MNEHYNDQCDQDSWNKAKRTGQKPPLKRKEIWAIRVRLQLAKRPRDLALFNLAIDSKLRGCDLVRLRVRDVAHKGSYRISGHHRSKEDRSACAVRDHWTDPGCHCGMDRASTPE